MDLLEDNKTDGARRHPWEIARIHALRRILPQAALPPEFSVLDFGAGDVFTSVELLKGRSGARLTAVDSNFSDQHIARIHQTNPAVALARDAKSFPPQSFDLLLLLDVLEHIDDAQDVFNELCRDLLAPNGYVLVTVPAFQGLFSDHDRYLKHFRRYRWATLRPLLEGASLRTVGHGYLFGSLLLPRILSVLGQSLPIAPAHQPSGVGSWGGGPLSTQLVTSVLDLDNRLLLASNKIGLRPPGLTIWALCQKTP